MPSAEIITIGTEILLGQIVDTNSQYISNELSRLGVDCFYHTTVGDNPDRIVAAIKTALLRSEVVITTGGLGPTADDLTMECVAKALNTELEQDVEVVKDLEVFFEHRGKAMPQTNLKQALRPMGANILPNPTGTAPGIIWELSHEQLVEKRHWW